MRMWKDTKEKKMMEQIASTVYSERIQFEETILNCYIQDSYFEFCKKAGMNCNIGFTTWPSFLDKDATIDEKYINICSTCFGIMTMMRVLEWDLLVCVEKEKVKKTIESAVNTIVMLRGDAGEWPPHWEIGKTKMKNAGSINQTTLCLTALLKSGFFNKKSIYEEKNLTKEQQKVRMSILTHSLRWLVEAQSNSGHKSGWNYGMDKSGKVSIMATANVTDLFQKISIECKENDMFEKIFNELDSKLLTVIRELISDVYEDYRRYQLVNGGYSKLYRTTEEYPASMLHTLYALNVLLSGNGQMDTEIKKALDYIIRNYKNVDWSLERPDECFEEYEYFTILTMLGADGKVKEISYIMREKYEIVPQTLLIITICNVLRKYEGIGRKEKEHLIKIVNEQWFQINNRSTTSGVRYVVKGNRRNEGENYPLYILYYCILSYIYTENSKENFTPSRKKENMSLYIGVSAAFLSTVFLLIQIFGIGEMVNLILVSVLTMLFSIISRPLIRCLAPIVEKINSIK